MIKKWKWILGAGVVLVLAVFITIYFILSSYDFNDLKPQISKVAMDATGRKLDIGGDIDLEIGLTPTLVLTNIKFENAPWGSRPDLAKINRFMVQIALLPLIRGKIEVKQFSLAELDILIETNKKGESNLVFESPGKTETPREKEQPSEDLAKLPAFAIEKMRIQNSRLTYKDGVSGKTYGVGLKRLIASSKGMNSPLDIELEGVINKAPIDLKGSLGAPADLISNEKSWSLNLKTDMLGTSISLDGSIKDVLAQKGIDLNFTVNAQDLNKLSDFTGTPLPIDGPLEFSGNAKDEGPKAYKVSDLKLTQGSNTINGTVSVDLTKEVPLLTAMLSSEKLDLRLYLPQMNDRKKKEQPAKRKEKTDKVFPSDPLPLDVFSQVEATMKLRFGKVLLPRLAVNDLNVDAALKNGRLAINPLSAIIGGGKMTGKFNLSGKDKAAALDTKLKADGIALGKMLKELNVTDLLEGNLELDVNLKGRGKSVAALMASLDGYTSIVMDNGRINNKYIELLGADLSGSLFRMFNPLAEKKDYTEVNCMVSRFDIQKGLAKNSALVFDTPKMSVIGGGKIDLRSEKLDLSLKPNPKEGLGADGVGKLSFNLGELAKPFKLGGTLAKPALALDATQAALAIGKTAGAIALFGPVGIAAVLAGGSKGDQNPCIAAIEAAKTGVKASSSKKPEKKKGVVEKTTEGVSGTLKKLFGQ